MYFLSCLIETHKGLELHEDKKIQQNVFFFMFLGWTHSHPVKKTCPVMSESKWEEG